MRALSFDVTVSGFLRARTLGRWTEAATFGPLSNLRLREVPSPALRGPEWVRLQVLACGICGTDLANLTYSASPAMEPFGSFPAVPGHEILARVVEVGDGVRRVEVGQRVVVDPIISCRVRGRVGEGECLSCRAGHHGTCELAGEEGDPAGAPPGGEPLRRGLTIGYHADLPGGWGEEMIAHESQLFPVPSAIGDRAAVLVEPLSIGMRAVLNGGPAGPHEDVLVIGSGPIAMGAIWALRAAGFEGSIVAQTKRENEAELARLMGADEVVKPGMEARQVLVETGALAYQPIVGDDLHRLLQRVEPQQRALDPHRKLRDPGEGPEIPRANVLRRLLVAVHHLVKRAAIASASSSELSLEQVRHHRDRGLRDRAPFPGEPHILDDVSSSTGAGADLVAAGGVAHVDLDRVLLELPRFRGFR
jgi:threonine dehydrogenase-like Zn-dependent dehydrogenase